LTDRRMPHPKTVMNALKTMGFTPTRDARNRAAVFYDEQLVKGLMSRYGISSVSSGSSGPSVKEAGANGPTGANLETGVRGQCAVCQREAELRPDQEGRWLVCDSCHE